MLTGSPLVGTEKLPIRDRSLIICEGGCSFLCTETGKIRDPPLFLVNMIMITPMTPLKLPLCRKKMTHFLQQYLENSCPP